MGTAYTPGLTVSPNATIRRLRRLPIKGNVLVEVGQAVSPATVVARASLPGLMQSVKVASILSIDSGELEKALKVSVGDVVEKDQVIAQTKSLFGWLKSDCKSPVAGVVELITHSTGSVGIRLDPIPIEVTAYIGGKVYDVIEGEGAQIETPGALVQGIFGIGGERTGVICVVAGGTKSILDAPQIGLEHEGKILIGGANVTLAALRRASEVGVVGIVAGAIIDRDLVEFLGYDIGVAITGHEAIDITVVLTEGFGTISMAERTYKLFESLDGQVASISGATQIRAGVIRPEVVIPHEIGSKHLEIVGSDTKGTLDVGRPIRIIREPYFGELATVDAMPPNLAQIESGATVRILEAKLANGSIVTVPRANVELLET